MPLYDYACSSCGAKKEVQHSMSEIGKIEVACDQCGEQMKKMLSAPTLIGFDNVGRSVSNKDKPKGANSESSKKSTEAKKSTKKSAA